MRATIKSPQVRRFGIVLYLLIVFTSSSFAGSATWKSSPASGDWNTAANWTPQAVPNGPSDVATFATSNQTAVSLSAQTEVSGIIFNSGASPFTITVPPNNSAFGLNITGVGVTNNSGTTQKFVVEVAFALHTSISHIQFFNSATAGHSTSYAINNGAELDFNNSSSADSGTFVLNGDQTFIVSNINFRDSATAQNGNFTLNGFAVLHFLDTSTAGSGTFTLNRNPANGRSSTVLFSAGATAGNATFTINDGGEVAFPSGSSAGAATLIANPGTNGGSGGQVQFGRSPTGGGAPRVELFGNGTGDSTDGYLQLFGSVTIGSLEGTGSVLLNSKRLTVGSNNLSSTFSGVIVDCTASNPACGSVGSLRKTGKGTLTLSHSSGNTYTGGTTINKGTLSAINGTGSATGSGAVQVNVGTLGGTGKINGAVTVGTGTSSGAILLPGNSATKPGTLTINSTLTFNSLSTYKCVLNRSTPIAGKVSALGVIINSNAPFTFVDTGTGTLATGTVFTVINNTSANPIFGRFSNLANGSTFTSNGNSFKVSYTGGTGNDLTLKVVQ